MLPLAQVLSAKTPDIDALADQFARLQSQFLNNMLPWVLASQLIAILAYWIASNIVAREEGKFMNAIKLWILYWLASLGIVVLVSGVLMFASANNPSPALTFATLCVSVLLVLVVIFGLPMKVYNMSFPASIGFLILTFILSVAANLGAGQFLASPIDPEEFTQWATEVSRISPVDRKKLTDRIAGRRAAANDSDEVIAADRSKSIEERHAAVQRIYAALETRRQSLNAEDKAALDAYTRDEARYQQLLSTLQKDAAAAQR
ncbi:MAG: hypothetical protein V4710_10885 [Verrucomicrobiota bacterium]